MSIFTGIKKFIDELRGKTPKPAPYVSAPIPKTLNMDVRAGRVRAAAARKVSSANTYEKTLTRAEKTLDRIGEFLDVAGGNRRA